jgi:hypothetical protein
MILMYDQWPQRGAFHRGYINPLLSLHLEEIRGNLNPALTRSMEPMTSPFEARDLGITDFLP